jgi:hypothetical protein
MVAVVEEWEAREHLLVLAAVRVVLVVEAQAVRIRQQVSMEQLILGAVEVLVLVETLTALVAMVVLESLSLGILHNGTLCTS